jgi:cell division protein FtsL
MAQSATTQVIPNVRENRGTSFGVRYSTFIIVAIVLLIVILIYIGTHTRMTALEYNVATEMGTIEKMLEEQKKMKLEYAMLKSPQRIENIARTKLQMSYPESDQIIVLKKSGE